MKVQNFDKEMDKICGLYTQNTLKPKLLLHSCCAPCSSSCIERLKPFFDITVFYYNPNIDSVNEYLKRSCEQERLCKEFNVKVVVKEFDSSVFVNAVKGHEEDTEGGKRCEICFALRLNKTAEYAKSEGFDYFTTTLTVSPLKNANVLNNIGYELEKKYNVKFLPSDFKKKNGYLRSIQLSKEYNLYRQNYCGCIFSKNKNPE